MTGINAGNLRKILTSYAVCNPELNYCQGMNFIAGFLFLLFKDEAVSFAVLRDLIHRYQMGRMFDTSQPMLKLHFYQLDRLISILLPDLHAHLKVSDRQLTRIGGKRERVIVQQRFLHYSVHIGHQQPGQPRVHVEASPHLGLFPDRKWSFLNHLQYGWKAIFKASVVILHEFEEQLLDMPFEIMLIQIVNLPQKYLC